MVGPDLSLQGWCLPCLCVMSLHVKGTAVYAPRALASKAAAGPSTILRHHVASSYLRALNPWVNPILSRTYTRCHSQMVDLVDVPTTRTFTSIFNLAQKCSALQGSDAQALQRIFRITNGNASCTVGPKLSTKYNMDQDNKQLVVSITNMWTMEQAWFNEVRSRKPQTFVAGSRPVDPTGGGGVGRCDFCDYEHLTATDPWGRIDSEHAVTASNLFKYGEPYHGLALLKAHDPLTFTLDQVRDLMSVSQQWFDQAAVHYDNKDDDEENHAAMGAAGKPLHGFFLWNALARAGASQYHAHAQLMATTVPVPTQEHLNIQAVRYSHQYPNHDLIADMLAAHRAAGLLRACVAKTEEANEWRVGTITANGHTTTTTTTTTSHSSGSHLSLPKRAWVAASLSPIKDMEVLIALELNNQQNTGCGMQADLSHPAFCRALHATLRALIDTLGVESFNVGVLNVPMRDGLAGQMSKVASSGDPRFMLAKVVSRGRASQPASDFGCLEVIGGASIGHTDPYRVIAAVEQQLTGCLVNDNLDDLML